METSLSWVATVATIAAASITASNLGTRITGYGFVVFTFGSICWLSYGLAAGEPALVWTNVVLTALNIFGVWRWLGRQASVEEGGKAAAAASARAPGESTFPVSLLTSARVTCSDGQEIGHCVDGIAGCESGRLAYLVVSEGGVAGVGEALRKLDWSNAQVDSDVVRARISAERFRSQAKLPKDEWPAR